MPNLYFENLQDEKTYGFNGKEITTDKGRIVPLKCVKVVGRYRVFVELGTHRSQFYYVGDTITRRLKCTADSFTELVDKLSTSFVNE